MNPISDTPQSYNTVQESCITETHSSSVSWPSITAGALASISVSIVLFSLGSGIGLASLPPWTNSNSSLTAFTLKMAIFLIVVQWISSAVGAYLTGRLRVKRVGLHTQEAFFRDTSNGFLSWALATVITTGLLISGTTSIISGGVQAASMVAAGTVAGSSKDAGDIKYPLSYYVDSMFRSDKLSENMTNKDFRSEATTILMSNINSLGVGDVDKAYLTRLVTAHTGLSENDATEQVERVIGQINVVEEKAKRLVDDTRKAAEHFAFFTFFSMLVGAFIACVGGALGGQRRDLY